MRDASFHLLDRAAWPRSEHFDYYIRTVKCRYDLTAHLTVTALRERGKALGLRFYPLLLYITARAINANREFRMGFNEYGAPGYWDFINPSYTIFHDDDKTFSDVWSEYDESFPVFYQNVLHDMETYKDIKGVRAKPGRPANCCPKSAPPHRAQDSPMRAVSTRSAARPAPIRRISVRRLPKAARAVLTGTR